MNGQLVQTVTMQEMVISQRKINSSYGSFEIDVPQDRLSSFAPQVVKKRQKDISGIEQKIILHV